MSTHVEPATVVAAATTTTLPSSVGHCKALECFQPCTALAEDRVIARTRTFLGYQNGKETWSANEEIKVGHLVPGQNGREWTFDLKKGGQIKFYTGMINQDGCQRVAKAMERDVKYHQYDFKSRHCKEPRLHILLSKAEQDLGYAYHR
jgi:hypothetical protein